jgi:hypothetical protein
MKFPCMGAWVPSPHARESIPLLTRISSWNVVNLETMLAPLGFSPEGSGHLALPWGHQLREKCASSRGRCLALCEFGGLLT